MKNIVGKLDKLISQKVRLRGECEVCGKTEGLQCHHFIGRRAGALRFALQNLVCVCPSCHTFGRYSFHQNPLWGVEWFKRYRPDDYEYCKEHTSDPPLKAWQKNELLEELKNKFGENNAND